MDSFLVVQPKLSSVSEFWGFFENWLTKESPLDYLENSNPSSLKRHEGPVCRYLLITTTIIFSLFQRCQTLFNMLGLTSPSSKLPCPPNSSKQFICNNNKKKIKIPILSFSLVVWDKNGHNFILPSKKHLAIKLLIILLKSNVHQVWNRKDK